HVPPTPPPVPLTPCFPPQVGSGEVWSPVCLPAFNPDGYFYAYAAALDEDRCGGSVTLILLLTQREAFYAAAACRRRLEAELRAQGWMEEFGAAIKGGYTAYGASQPGAPELRHFLYKPLEGDEEVLQVPQFTCPDSVVPYSRPEEQQRLFALYHGLQGRLHCAVRPLRLLYRVTARETLLAWVTRRFELYACLSPLLPKAAAIAALTRLLRWLRKEDEWLFARCPPPFAAAAAPEGGEG
ncbi:vacuolar fusion protein MON1 homolog B-like, partial [Lagopus leucura]|uniref:vacuolar fusion protein MON1 homolog B-like n=1 Tax=Lagopus leucura TaxID=30410 RepID=UPI001C665A80